ncbi:hypothetical protein ACQYWQ_17995 [Streptomyces sp. P6-2-1]|uniref:hypothetical protein n=1 Tax=unclassified Streptomyces TaxID=2593676 RepID=UPI003D35CF5A
MSLTDADRLPSQLSRLEDAFPGYRTGIVEGSIVMSPIRPHHNRTMAGGVGFLGARPFLRVGSDQRRRFPYGTVVKVDSPVLGEVRVPRDSLPVDPGA